MTDPLLTLVARAIAPDAWKLRDEDLLRRDEWEQEIRVGWGAWTFEQWVDRFVGKSLEQAQAALSVIREQEGWRPISEAAKDGTPIIGGFFNQPWAESHREGDIVKCWFQPEFDAFISSAREMQMHNGWTFADGSTRSVHSPTIENVTHFRPLPAPPLEKM